MENNNENYREEKNQHDSRGFFGFFASDKDVKRDDQEPRAFTMVEGDILRQGRAKNEGAGGNGNENENNVGGRRRDLMSQVESLFISMSREKTDVFPTDDNTTTHLENSDSTFQEQLETETTSQRTEVHDNPNDSEPVNENVEEVIYDGVVIDDAGEQETKTGVDGAYNLLLLGLILVLTLVTSIIVPVVVRRRETENDLSLSPTMRPRFPSDSPSITPSALTLQEQTQRRFKPLTKLLSNISDYDSFFDDESPQYKALRWLAYEDNVSLDAHNLEQRYILAVFYYATNGDDWAYCSKGTDCDCVRDGSTEIHLTCFRIKDRHTDFLNPGTECNWMDISCEDDKVIEMTFERMDLSGTIPSEIQYLTKLRSFDVWQNRFFGTLPDLFHHMIDLEIFNVYNCGFHGQLPKSLLNHTKFRQLDFGRNRFTGTLPTAIAKMKNLKALRFWKNEFTGTIPTEYGRLQRIERFQFSHNYLTGTVPNAIYNLSTLVTLDMRNNSLTGTLPAHIDLPNLKNISLALNKFEGTVPDALFKSGKLREVDIAGNNFTGTISHSMMENPLRFLSLYGNSFTGTVPSIMCERIESGILKFGCGSFFCEPRCCECML